MMKYANRNTIIKLLERVLKEIFETGVVPDMSIGKIVPIVQDTIKNCNDINNIRPVKISNVYSNIIEKYILEGITNQIKMNEKQFGFLKNASTQHGLFIMKEIFNFFKKRRSRIYACAIDALKAFDKV